MSEKKIGVPFAATPTWILRADGLSRGAKHLYAVLASYANGLTHKCCPSLATLATDCQANKRTVLRWIAELETNGAVEVASGGGRAPNQYRLFTKPGEVLSGDATATGDISATPAVTPEPHQHGHRSHTSGDISATPAVTPEPQELERSKRKAETTLSPTSLKSGESDSTKNKTNTVTQDLDSDLHEAFDGPGESVTPPPALQPVQLLAKAVFAAFVQATKSPVLVGKWSRPSFNDSEALEQQLRPWVETEDPTQAMTPLKIVKLVQFSQRDEFWRDRTTHPKSFAKNLEAIVRAYENSLGVLAR